MSLSPGHKLAHYEILEPIGKGGMGEVYRARDGKLGRDVAIKLLRDDLSSNPELLRRFEQEARSASALNHPNIITIHEIGEHESIRYIVMEYVEGQTLRQLLDEGPLPTTRMLELAAQIAEGLSKAHSAGIVHRDLKPENLMITKDGFVKILDFGLAKLIPPIGAIDSGMRTPMKATQQVVILGTAPYMSPEQAAGRPLGYRSDQFSLGSILYEMATGRIAFQRDTVPQTIAAILADEPERISRLKKDVPASYSAIVERCLGKQPEDRYESTADLAGQLKTQESVSGTRSSRRSVLAATALVLAAALALLLGLNLTRLSSLLRPTPTLAILPWAYDGPEQSTNLAQLLPLALSDRLRMLETVHVTPFAVSRSYEPQEEALSVAQQLEVNWVLQGELSVHSETLAVTLTLSGQDGKVLRWPKRIPDVQDVLSITEEVAREVSAAIGAGPLGKSGTPRSQEALKYYLEGRTYLEGWDVEGSYIKAEEAFGRAVAEDESFAKAHAGLALALWARYRRTGETDVVEHAAGEARRAVSLAPSLPEAHLALGVVLLGQGRAAEAAEAFKKALELGPDDDAVCSRIADAYAALGRLEDAEAMYQRAIELRPGYWNSYVRKGSFYLFVMSAKSQEAKPLFGEVIRLRPESAVGYHGLATAHIVAGDFTAAEPLLQAAIRINPSGNAHNDLGYVYYATGRFELALEQFRLAVEWDPDASILIGLADTLRQLEDQEEAAESYTHAVQFLREQLEINPKDAEARGMFSQGLAALGQCDMARTEASQAAPPDGELPFVDYLVAVTYSLCGDREKVLHHTKRALLGGVKLDVMTSPDLKPFLDDPSIKVLLE